MLCISKPLNTTKPRARKELRSVEERVEKGVFLPEKKFPTFSQVAGDWLEYQRPKRRETTRIVTQAASENTLVNSTIQRSITSPR